MGVSLRHGDSVSQEVNAEVPPSGDEERRTAGFAPCHVFGVEIPLHDGNVVSELLEVAAGVVVLVGHVTRLAAQGGDSAAVRRLPVAKGLMKLARRPGVEPLTEGAAVGHPRPPISDDHEVVSVDERVDGATLVVHGKHVVARHVLAHAFFVRLAGVQPNLDAGAAAVVWASTNDPEEPQAAAVGHPPIEVRYR
jgi:hypothetical protein